MTPEFLLILLSLTVYRLTRLITKDTLPPVLWLRDHISGGWRPMTDQEWAQFRVKPSAAPWPFKGTGDDTIRYVYRWSWSPYWLAELWSCPWCVSAWIAGAVTAVTDITVGMPYPWLMGMSAWALGALMASREYT
jgi:hypothetical protein